MPEIVGNVTQVDRELSLIYIVTDAISRHWQRAPHDVDQRPLG